MCKEERKREFEDALKCCALKHIGEARKLISKSKFEDVELSYAEKHLKKMYDKWRPFNSRSTQVSI